MDSIPMQVKFSQIIIFVKHLSNLLTNLIGYKVFWKIQDLNCFVKLENMTKLVKNIAR